MPSFLAVLLAPPLCEGCGASGISWCAACAAIPAMPRWTSLASGLRVLSLFAFEGPVRRSIIDWKDEGRTGAARRVEGWLGAVLAPLLRATPDALVVPVPSSRHADRIRGRSVLLDAVRVAVPQAAVAPALTSWAQRVDQSGLSRAERARNLHGALAWDGAVAPRCILVDDVLTTGATLREAARAAQAAGVQEMVACVIARSDHRAPVAAAPHALA